ncbi:MAG: DUF6089 family protein [Saprospiraceae bacterium]
MMLCANKSQYTQVLVCRTLVIVLLWMLPRLISAQPYFIKLYAGSVYYHGDLTEHLLSSPGNFAYGLSLGKEVNPYMALSVSYLGGTLSGEDNKAISYLRKQRNLSFRSPLAELSIKSEFNINELFWKRLNKYNVDLILSFGVAGYKFNPMTFYQDNWIELQPVGTEGQKMMAYQDNKYSLYQWCIPFGFAVEMDFLSTIRMGIECSPRLTFTDYIDDVSSIYIHRDEFLQTGNVLGASLNNRQGEWQDHLVEIPTGTPRGNNKKRDWYTFMTFYLKYSFEKIK